MSRLVKNGIRIMKPSEAAELIIQARLYQNKDWDLFYQASCITGTGWKLKTPRNFLSKVYYEDGKPVAVALLKKYNGHLNVYVKPTSRKKGIGSKLVKSFLGKKDKYNIHGSTDSPSKGRIFRHNGLEAKEHIW